MTWKVEIAGDSELLKELPRVLQGPDIKASFGENGRLFLAGAMLDALPDPGSVVKTVSELLPRLSSLLHLYVGVKSVFEVKSVFWRSEGRLKQRMLEHFHITVTSPDGLEVLSEAGDSGATVAASLLRLSTTDSRVAKSLDLLAGRDRGWYELYDLIDAMGKVDGIVKRGWATRARLSAIRQTANHYRHRGSQAKSHRLPRKPPTFGEARKEVLELFDRWLRERLAKNEGI